MKNGRGLRREMPEVRVLLVDLETAWRGGQSQALLLLRGLRARGHAAELVSVRGAALAQRALAEGIPLHLTTSTLRRPNAARLLRRLLGERHVDVVHANEAHALTAAWLARTHRAAPLVAARRVLFPLSRGRLSLARYRAAARILAISQAVRSELLAAGLDPARLEVIPDGVELVPRISPEERSRARMRWGIAADEPAAAYVASLTTEKGHALLLEAFAELRRAVPRCRLLLAGSGPLRKSLEETARRANLLPAVRFAGFVEDLRSVYAACDIFLFPSLREGLGSSLLSAMGCALPVVALAGGGVAEAVENGRNGLLVTEPAAALLAAAAARLLHDTVLARRLGEAASETVAARFSADGMIEATLRVFERLATGPSGAPGRFSA
jgi:glycosyltransferase involved in cell wall biosynthesis